MTNSMRMRTVWRARYNQQLQKTRRKMSNAGTFLATGTPVQLWRFIADEIGDINGGRFPLRPLKWAQISLEVPMPYLFWAVVPFELMRMWWDACERARETSAR